jgi:hypothetical protein
MLVYQLPNAKRALEKVSNYQGLDFAYAVLKNKQLIDNKLMEVDFIRNVSPEVVEYEEKRIKLCEEFAQKDENGKTMIENDLYVIIDRDTFKNKMDELLSMYRPFVEERQKQVELFNQKMNNVIDFEFVKIKKEDIPPQIATARELEDISFMIE